MFMVDKTPTRMYNILILTNKRDTDMLQFIQYFVVLGCVFGLFTLTVSDVLDAVSNLFKR